jgi:hypothetical protein
MITESPNLQLPLQCALAGWRQLMAGWRPAASTSSVRLIIFLEAGRSLARAVPHGHAQGYADVRGTATGQTIHRAKVFGCLGVCWKHVAYVAMAALRLSGARFTYGTIFLCTSYTARIDRTKDAYITTYILPPPLYYSLSPLETKLLD